MFASSNRCHATSNRCLTSSNKKLVVTSALLVLEQVLRPGRSSAKDNALYKYMLFSWLQSSGFKAKSEANPGSVSGEYSPKRLLIHFTFCSCHICRKMCSSPERSTNHNRLRRVEEGSTRHTRIDMLVEDLRKGEWPGLPNRSLGAFLQRHPYLLHFQNVRPCD